MKHITLIIGAFVFLALNFSTASHHEDHEVFQCYSCMSKSLRSRSHYPHRIINQQPLTQHCENITLEEKIFLINCTSFCVTLESNEVLFGQYKENLFIRGCFDKLFKANMTDEATWAALNATWSCQRRDWNSLLTSYGASRLDGAGHDPHLRVCGCQQDQCNDGRVLPVSEAHSCCWERGDVKCRKGAAMGNAASFGLACLALVAMIVLK